MLKAKDKGDEAPKSGEKCIHKTVVHQLAGVSQGDEVVDETKFDRHASQLVFFCEKKS